MRPAEKHVGVVGATGMVGRELLAVLESRRFPIASLRPFSSGRAISSVKFRGKSLSAPAPSLEALSCCSLIFFASCDEVSLEHAPALAKRGVWCLDDSAAFRLDPAVPLVIPEVNAGALSRDQRLIAGPNCTMTPAAVAAAPLHARFGLEEIRIASYQAVSGAGKAALCEFLEHTKSLAPLLAKGVFGRAPQPKAPKAKALPRSAAFNVIPQVGRFDERGDSSEERKVAAELRKVLGLPALKCSVTAVRVPVLRGHSLAIWMTFSKPVTPRQARTTLQGAAGLALHPEGDYPTPHSAGGKEPVFAGRVRQGAHERELALWLVGDNLLKGAALNAVQTAEELLRRGWL